MQKGETPTFFTQNMYKVCNLPIAFEHGLQWGMLVRTECSFLLMQGWKVMVIMQQQQL